MFRIVCMVEDRKLSKYLVATKGLIHSMELPQPVVNAVMGKGGSLAAASGGTVQERAAAHLIKIKAQDGATFSSGAVDELMRMIGATVNASSRKSLVKAGVMKNVSKGFYKYIAPKKGK